MDDQDRYLRELFAGQAVRDNGFSDRVMRRLRFRLLLRRLVLPAAVLLGGIVSLGPLLQLTSLVVDGLLQLPAVAGEALSPDLGAMVGGLLPFAGMLLILRLIDE